MQDNEVIAKILQMIETVRLFIRPHGGDVEFMSYENKNLKLRTLGSCVGCSMSHLTYKEGLEQIIRSIIEDINEIEFIEGNT